MRQHQQRSRFYYVLYTMLSSGVTLSGALRSQFDGSEFRRAARELQQFIANGSTLADAMHNNPLFTGFEVSMVHLGEQSGRLIDVLKTLSSLSEARYRRWRKIFSNLVYPMFVYFVAGPLLAIVHIFTRNVSLTDAAMSVLLWFSLPILLYILFKVLWPLCRSLTILSRLMNVLPLCGRLQFLLESSRFYWSMAIALHSGVNISEAFIISSQCCISPWYQQHFADMAQKIRREGCSVTEAMAAYSLSQEINSPIPMLIASGETSGTLDRSCEQISQIISEELTAKLDTISKLVPTFLYGLIVIYLAIQILSVFSGYISQINSLL